MIEPTHAQWEQLRRLMHVVDSRIPVAGNAAELAAFKRLLPVLGLAAREYASDPRDQSLRDQTVDTLDATGVRKALTWVLQHDQFVAGKFRTLVNGGAVQRLCRRAHAIALLEDGWPVALAVDGEDRVPVGIAVRSLSGDIEGRTTGGRRRCAATNCTGWDVSVSWETGQDTRICSAGWHYDPAACELRIVGGGEITARVATDPSALVLPRPRASWPQREVLLANPAWSALA